MTTRRGWQSTKAGLIQTAVSSPSGLGLVVRNSVPARAAATVGRDVGGTAHPVSGGADKKRADLGG